MRFVVDTDIRPGYVRITNYGDSELDIVAAALEMQRVLMNIAGHQHYRRRDLELVGYDNQEAPIERWGWVASSNSPVRAIPKRDELDEVEIRTVTPPEELPLPRKCLECMMEDETDDDNSPTFPTHSGDPRLKIPG
jgi:hypothetical protein